MFHDEVAWYFKHGIRDGEESDGQSVAVRCQARITEHVVAGLGVEHASIANISCYQF